MIIRSKRVFIKGALRPAALVLLSGRISAIRSYTYQKGRGQDLGSLMLLPGAIDPHVHFRDPEAAHKEDFGTGSAAALAGGVTSVIDMPNYANPPTITVGAYMEKERIAMGKSACDWGLHFGGTESNHELVRKFAPPSLKVFLAATHSPLTITQAGLERHMSSLDAKRPLLVHCEDGAEISRRAEKFKRHEQVRSPEVALCAVRKAAALGKKYKRRVHFCHLSTAAEIKAAKIWQGASVEATPHHLFMDARDIERLEGWGDVNPPLRSKMEIAALWANISKVDCIASDHAPHTARDKEAGACGFPGVQTTFPLVMDAVLSKRLTLKEAVRLLSSGPARTFGICKKGAIEVGFDADLIAFDPKGKWTVNTDDLYSKCGWSPYEGRELRGRIAKVFLRGHEAVSENEVLVPEGFGRKLEIEKNAPARRK